MVLSGQTIAGMKEFINVTKPLVDELKKSAALCESPSCPQKPYALIVEDNPQDAELMQLALSAMGCPSVVVGDADQAMAMMASDHYPLLFLDLKLPRIHGTQLLRQIRDLYPKTHTVIVTGTLDSWSTGELAQIGGYCGLVHKPLEKENVEEILRKHNLK